MNNIHKSGNIKFAMFIANPNSALQFLDLNLHTHEHNKIRVDLYAKPTNSFTYVLPWLAIPKRTDL